MIRIIITLVISFILISSAFTTASTKSLAMGIHPQGSCVTCIVKSGCRACAGGGDAKVCYTTDCSSCILEGICEPPPPNRPPSDSKRKPPSDKPTPKKDEPSQQDLILLQAIYLDCSSLKSEIAPRMAFNPDDNIIREIGAKHPRFAATLANLKNVSAKTGFYRVYWTPVEISALDVDAFLNRSENVDFFNKLNDRAHQLNKLIQNGSLKEISYQVSVLSLNAYEQVVTIKVIDSNSSSKLDPEYSLLAIKLSYAEKKQGKLLSRMIWEGESGQE